ncbi:MAG: hypothetical protein ACK2VD_18380 [Anaerolineae bacterium]|jgi:hypothetical protein
MFRRISSVLAVIVLGLLAAVPVFAAPGQPTFGAAIYADGVAWGTKGTTALPNPEGAAGSFDKLYIFTNGATGQLAVSEAGPGNPSYNGGRWETWTATWNQDTDVVVKSETDLLVYVDSGALTIHIGSPDFHPDYFQCPLLPVKD